jgi:quinol monooxygenase YgiN
MKQKTYLILSLFFMMTLVSKNMNAQKQDYMYRIAKIKIDKVQLESYKKALADQMNAAIKLEPGVLSYTAVSDKKDETNITILEVYKDQSSYQSHILTPHFKKYKEIVKGMVLSLELIDANLVVSTTKSDVK